MKNNEFEKFKKNILDYSEIYNNYIESMELWKDVTKYLEELRDKYRICPTFSLKKEIKEWELQERDYFNLFNEYQQKMINKGFDYDYDEKVEFLNLYDLFEKLTDEIKLIENKSKKFGSKKEIGTNRVETYNAEGRKKYIHEYLLNDYNSLVNQKKQILSRYKELYKKYIDFDVISIDSNVDLDQDTIIFDIDEGFELEKKYFNQMSIDEKIDYYKKRINSIINAKNTGKKKYIIVYGDKYYVPEKYEYLVRDYLKEIKKLNDSKQNISENEVNSDINVASEIICSDKDENYNEIISFVDSNQTEKDDNKVLNVDDNYNDIITIFDSSQAEKDDNYILKGDFDIYSQDEIKSDVEFKIFTEDTSRDIWSDSSLISDDKKNNEEIEECMPTSIIKQENISSLVPCPKNHEMIEVKSVKKPKKKLGLKKKLIAAAAAIAVAITTVFTAMSAFAISSFNNKKEDTNSDIDNSKVYEDIVPNIPIDDLHDKIVSNMNLDNNKSNINDFDSNVKTIVDSENNVVELEIGDAVNIQNNAYIYDDVYDAMNKTNGLEPYFDYDMDRNIKGFFVNCDGEYIYTENEMEVNRLLSNGGNIESVVVGNYEGAYNYDDIKPKVKVK